MNSCDHCQGSEVNMSKNMSLSTFVIVFHAGVRTIMADSDNETAQGMPKDTYPCSLCN